jgi:ATP-binding cassette, subfamily B, bacterial
VKRIIAIIKWIYREIKEYISSLVAIVVLSTILSLCRVGLAIVSQQLIDAAVGGLWNQVVKACIFFSIVILLEIGLRGITSILSVKTSEALSNKIRHRLYMHLTKVKWSEYSKYHSGDILTRITSDVGIVVEGVVSEIPEVIAMGVGLLAAFITLFYYDPVLAIFAFLLGPIALVIGYLFSKRFMNIHQRAQEAESDYRSYVQECLEHMLVLKTFCQETLSGEQFNKLQAEKKRLAVRKNYASVIASSFVTGGFWFSYLLAFGWGAMRLFENSITFGTLTAFLQLIGQIQSPFMGLAGTLPQVVSSIASAERLMELEKLSKEERSMEETDFNVTEVAFEQVNFEYSEDKPVLKNITAQIHAGEMIGLIGISGEGKTTLIHLLMQLIEPIKGNIVLYYSNDKKKMAEASIRTLISYVPQGNTLFSGTLSYNLKFGCPEATEEEQIAALKYADAWDFVEKLPEGIHTVIGERGLGLSEGQAQRIAIARALLRKTPILLLDEATSALDTETEGKVLKSIMELEPKRTCIVITHRPSILEYCERIWKISNGELIEVNPCFNEVAASEVI